MTKTLLTTNLSNQTRLLATAVLMLCLCLPAAVVQAQVNGTGEDRLNLEMYWELQNASNPQISPDGRQVIYTRGWIDPKSDSRKSEIWIMDASGERKRFLAEGSSPSWSPDGTRIAYTASGEPGGSQIYIRWMDDEGATSQVTRMTKSPSNIRWSPDGNYLAFTRSVDSRPSLTIQMPARPEGASWTVGPERYQPPPVRSNQAPPLPFQNHGHGKRRSHIVVGVE